MSSTFLNRVVFLSHSHPEIPLLWNSLAITTSEVGKGGLGNTDSTVLEMSESPSNDLNFVVVIHKGAGVGFRNPIDSGARVLEQRLHTIWHSTVSTSLSPKPQHMNGRKEEEVK
jgi:hypothetical protein